MNEKKSVLYVIGMEQNAESLRRKIASLQHNSIILQVYGPTILPFGDFMRDIIIAVYRENIEEICITVPKDEQKFNREIAKSIYENKDLQKKLQTVDYLFENCMPEFSNGSLREWLEGNAASSNSRQNIVDVIRNHPLLPSNVKVTELGAEGGSLLPDMTVAK